MGQRKGCILACFLLLQGMLLWGWDDGFAGATPLPGWRLEIWDEPIPEIEEPVPDEAPRRERRPFFRNRAFEISTQWGLHVSNDFIAYADFFQNPFRILGNLIRADSFADFLDNPSLYYRDNIYIRVDDFFSGFRFNFGLDIEPLSININVRDRWGFGLDIGHLSATGNLYLPEAVLGLHETEKEVFGVGAAAFVDVGIPVFFHVRGFRVRLRPAAFVPLFYIEPGITYSFGPSASGGRHGQRFELAYDLRIFSAFNLDDLFGDGDGDPLSAAQSIAASNFGYDISLGIEYPLLRQLTLGVDFSNIPLPFLGATVNHYARFRGNVFFDTSYIDLGDLIDGARLPDGAHGFSTEDFVFGMLPNGRRIRRPFAMLLHANYRPFGGRQIVALLPSFGFSINRLYARIAGLEGGLSARLNLGNVLVTTVGINYNDRRWQNSIAWAFNLRLFEIDLGLSSQSPDFVQSFRGAGIGATFGFKMGL